MTPIWDVAFEITNKQEKAILKLVLHHLNYVFQPIKYILTCTSNHACQAYNIITHICLLNHAQCPALLTMISQVSIDK